MVITAAGLAGFLLLGMLMEGSATANSSPADVATPKTQVTVIGDYNSNSGWYYARPPLATFTVIDDQTDIKEIVVYYKVADKRCKNGTCILEPGDSLALKDQARDGKVTLRYFGVDEAGNTEKPQKLSLLKDTQPPQVYVLKIKTESMKNIPAGNLCKSLKKTSSCVVLNASINEVITFEILGSDRISGLDNIYYRVLSRFNNADWSPVEDSMESAHTLNLHFDKKSAYVIKLKAVDIAGNESAIKEFLISVT